MRRHLQIIALSLLAACTYGIIHDEVTIRVCPEYFTVAHPSLFPPTSLTLLAVCWGIAATAPIGAALGLILAQVSQSGTRPPMPVPPLARAIAKLLALMAASATAAGATAYFLSRHGWIAIPEGFAEIIPESRCHRFMAVWFAHGASYAVGLLGGAILCWRVWRDRGKPSALNLLPTTPGAITRVALLILAAAAILWWRFARH